MKQNEITKLKEYNAKLLQKEIDQHNKISVLSQKVYDLQKEINRLSEHIRELQKDKGKLIDKNKELKKVLKEVTEISFFWEVREIKEK